MANRTSAEWRQYIYDKATKVSDKYKKRFPSFAEFNTALDDPETGGDLVQKVLTGMTKVSDNFFDRFPDYETLSSTLAVNSKYTGKQRHDMRETAKDGIKNLYKGDFEKLWNNRDRLTDKLNGLKVALAEGGNVNTQDAMNLQKGIVNLQKGIELVDAYKGISSARSDAEFDTLIDGYVPAPQVSEYGGGVEVQVPTENKFLKQVMPTAEYKGLELQGRTPTTMEGLFPEYSRREREGGTGVAKALGGAKDVLRMSGRALRPIGEEIMGTADPNTSYWEEFARPDKYKTTSQEMSDEILGLQGIGGAGAKIGAMRIGRKLPALAQEFNKVLPFINAAEKIKGRVGGSFTNPSLAGQGFRNLLAETPNIALDVGYEATRSDDEVSNPLLAGLGGAVGASIAPALSAGASGILGKFTGNTALRKEIMGGTPTMLNEELQLAKAMMPDADLTSVGGKNQLIGIKENLGDFKNKNTGEYFGGQIGALSDERRAMSQSLDRDLANEYQNQEYAGLRGGDQPLGASDALKATDRISDKYLDQIAGAHPKIQDQMAGELNRLGEVGIPSATELMEEAKKLKILNPETIPNSAMLKLEKEMAKVKGIGEKYKVFKEFKEAFPDAKTYRDGLPTKAPSIEKAFDTRTELRQGGKGFGREGDQKALLASTEEIQKKVMSDYLTKSTKGRAIKAKHDKIAELYGLKESLPELFSKEGGTEAKEKIGRKIDLFFEEIGRSRMNISTKGNSFNDMLELEDAINKETGMNTDFISNAVLRRIQNKSFWNDVLADGNPAGAKKAMTIVKNLGSRALFGGKLPAILSQIARKAKEKDPTKERQKGAKRNTTGEKQIGDANKVFTDPRMKSILEGIEKRKESDRLKLNLQGNR